MEKDDVKNNVTNFKVSSRVLLVRLKNGENDLNGQQIDSCQTGDYMEYTSPLIPQQVAPAPTAHTDQIRGH